MTNRPIDKTRKSNIKCENCSFAGRSRKYIHIAPGCGFVGEVLVCSLTNKERNYWNRCKYFEWSDSNEYMEES